MKKAIFIIAITLLSLSVFSQTKINTNDLIGYWEPDQESSQLFFWKNSNGDLQMQDICGSTGEPLQLIEFKINQNNIFVKEVSIENKWITASSFTIINKTTLQRVVEGDINVIITYTKIK
jgi:hypothetical protein